MKLLFAWRYFKSKKSTTAINIIAWISVLAITVGTAALIIVLSVFNGFEGLVKSLYGDFYSDIRITPKQGKFFSLTDEKINQLKKIKGVSALSTTVEEKAVLMNGDYQTIVYLRGVEENYQNITNLKKHLVRGNYDLGLSESPSIIIGIGVENAIGADPTSTNEVIIYLPNRKANGFSQDAMHSYATAVSGTFMVQQEFDNKYAFTNIAFLKYMLDLKPDEYSSVELRINQSYSSAIAKQVAVIVGDDFKVQNKFQQNQSLFSVMEVEKWVVYGILCLILIVAAFNMIGALTMLVLEKQKDIAVLKAMGANNTVIQKIFLYEGLVLAGVGAGAGAIIAFLVCVAQQQFHLVKLQGGTFIIDYYPVKMIPFDFLLVALTVTVVALLASWFPSRKAAQQPFSLKA